MMSREAVSRAQAASVARPSARSGRIVYLSMAVYAALFVAAATTNYLLYLEPRFDLGNMIQAVWSTSHGRFMAVSAMNGNEISRLGAHVDPFLALLVPLWWAWSNPIVLLAAQAVAVASGALPVYWLARKHLGEGRFAVTFAIAYLLYPATQFNAFAPIGIHAVSFAIPLILFAIWFLDEDRLVWFLVFAILAATTKEEIAAAVGGLGLWYALRRGHRRFGGAVFVAGLGVTAVNMLVVIPHYAPPGFAPFAARYENVGGTPGGVVRTAFTDPSAFAHEMLTWHKLLFLVLLFVPFVGLWAREPLMLVGALPDLVIDLLSSKPEQSTVYYHYTAGIIPFVVAASVLGAARLRRPGRTLTGLAVVIGCLALISPMDYTALSVSKRSHREVVAIRQALKLIPPATPVSASQSIGAYVSTRRSVAVFPQIGSADWVIVGAMETKEDDPQGFKRTLRKLRSSPQWQKVFDSAGVAVFAAIRN
jgi:uncharacterized membrane protein